MMNFLQISPSKYWNDFVSNRFIPTLITTGGQQDNKEQITDDFSEINYVIKDAMLAYVDFEGPVDEPIRIKQKEITKKIYIE